MPYFTGNVYIWTLLFGSLTDYWCYVYSCKFDPLLPPAFIECYWVIVLVGVNFFLHLCAGRFSISLTHPPPTRSCVLLICLEFHDLSEWEIYTSAFISLLLQRCSRRRSHHLFLNVECFEIWSLFKGLIFANKSFDIVVVIRMYQKILQCHTKPTFYNPAGSYICKALVLFLFFSSPFCTEIHLHAKLFQMSSQVCRSAKRIQPAHPWCLLTRVWAALYL